MLCFLLDKLNICSIIRIGESVRGGSRLQEGRGTGMKKVYVRVTSDFDATGYMQPKSIVWTNGKIFPSRASGTSALPNPLGTSAVTAIR